MYSSIELATKFIKYYLWASNGKGHGIHSPFVYDFIHSVLRDQGNSKPPLQLEVLRKKLLSDQRTVTRQDLGAGSRKKFSEKDQVARIAATALKNKKYAQLMYRLVTYYHPNMMIELGTSLGLTTAYLAKANENATIFTLEGNPSIAAIARENFELMGLNNIRLKEGHFDQTLPDILKDAAQIDLAYIDGNHTYAATIRYFEMMVSCSHSDTILVFDDIHWSAEMETAWEEITHHPAVSYTIDVFFMGFVFFKKEFKVKQQFSIRF